MIHNSTPSHIFLLPIIPKTLPIFYRKCPCLSSIQLPKSPCLYIVLYCYNHMYRTLTNPEPFRSLPDRSVILDNIRGNVDCSFFNIILQYTLAKCVFYIVCESLGFILTFQFIYTCFFKRITIIFFPSSIHCILW